MQIKGVAALFGDDDPISDQPQSEVAIALIDLPPTQPRRYFDPEKLEQLALSIKEKGVLEPILLRPKDGGRYELVAGERRLRAATSIGLSALPAVIRELSDVDAFEVALIENLQREDLNPVEEVEGVLQLLSSRLSCSITEVRSRLERMLNEHKGRVSESTSNVTGSEQIIQLLASAGVENWLSFVTNKLPLLNLPEDVLTVLREGKIEYTKARAIARVKDQDQREELLYKAVAQGLSLAELKTAIAAVKPQVETSPQDELKTRLTSLGSRVKRSKALGDDRKRKKLEQLLSQIDQLLEE